MAVALALALTGGIGTAAAQEGERPVAALVGPVSPQIVARVRGQTTDLPWRIEVVEGDETLPPEARGVSAARTIAARVAFVLVLAEEPGRVVIVRLVPGREVETRLLAGARDRRLGESARAEAISLIIRAALAEAGPEAADGAREGPDAAATRDDEEDRSEGAASPAGEVDSDAAGPRVGAQVFAGAGLSVDGRAPLANLGPRLRASLAVEDVHVGAEVHLSTHETLTSPDLVLALLRIEVHAAFAVTWWLAPDLGLALGVGAGATLFERTTRETGPALDPTESRWLVSPSAALEARLGWLLDPRVGLELSVGVLALLAPPSLVVATPRGEDARHTLWPVGPRAALGVTFQ